MFRTSDALKLRMQLDRFNVPMFVAELLPDGSDFRILAINKAHERQSGLQFEEVMYRPLASVLAERDVATVRAHFTRCITGAPQLRYREILDMPRGPLIWNTTLHHILPRDRNGMDRVVGSSVVIQRMERDQQDALAFEDIRYFAATSSFKLGQIAAILDAVENGQINPEKLVESATFIAGLCRTIDVTMQELRMVAQDRLEADVNQRLHLIEDSKSGQDGLQAAITALIDLTRDNACPRTRNPVVAPADNAEQAEHLST